MNKIIYNIIGFNEEAVMIGCTLVTGDLKKTNIVDPISLEYNTDHVAFVETDKAELNEQATFQCPMDNLTYDKIEEFVKVAESKQIKIEFI